MAIAIDRYEALAGSVLQIYEEAERTMMRRVSNRLQRGITQPGWTERKYGEMQDVTREMRHFVGWMSTQRRDVQEAAIKQAYTGSQTAFINDARMFSDAAGISELTANTKKVVSIMAELDASMNAIDRNILRNVDDQYASIVGRASALVATGSITYREAVKRELNDWSTRGITSFVDRAGRHWDMATYAEMATLTAIERATMEGYLDSMREFGYDLAEIDSHVGACPLCEAWENVIISISGDTKGYPTLDDAMGAGVFHPRCSHELATYYEGISRQGRTQPRPVREPSRAYSVRSEQRSLERHIRQWKRRMAVADSPEAERAAHARVQMYQAKIRELIGTYNEETDPNYDHLPRKYWREGGRQKLSAAAKQIKPIKILPRAK